MKKTINIWLVLLIALLFTGCTETMLPEENMDKTEQFLGEKGGYFRKY